jgi:PAS domain S-box-containing protein
MVGSNSAEERMFAGVFGAAPSAMLVADDAGRYVAANDAACVLLGRSREQILSLRIVDVSPSDVEVDALWERFLEEGELSGEYVLVRPDGSRVDVVFEARANVAPGRHLSVMRDVTSRRALERDLADAQLQTESVLELISDAFFVIDRDSNITYANAAAERVLGRDRHTLIGRNVWAEYPAARGSEFERQYMRVRQERVAVSFEAYYPHPLDGWFAVRAYPLEDAGIAVYATDITERVRVREHLEHARRLESLGVLAAGVSHDFNTALAMIRGHVELIREYQGDTSDEAVQASLATIDGAIDRARGLTQALLAFGRQDRLEPELVEVNTLVERLRPLVEPLLRPRIELEVELTDSADAWVAVDTAIEQSLLNLVTNARDAMPDGGQVTIATGVEHLDPSSTLPGLTPGRYVTLRVSDTGEGMDSETRERAPEPFFTTKHHETGTGMGLTRAYGLASQAGGTVTIDSTKGAGTTVTVWLPAAEPPAT